ncbi:hypothetical protein [Paeniglutamicibacter cryotolerans]|uniref:Uncharacterized protein n=1 Tax=Paeniglutamicibacter cryotolerans TaxID=670079 RepID=A0A839QI01_9MICC|nr:hypothetical protein [Paeniglutamicibacter cryotolerans]MBB2996018.1 hypothetical protein [Paeniglutamicibacter cryotolerans]
MEATKQPRTTGTQYAWTGYVLGIACMAGLFIYALVGEIPQLLVMSSIMAALLGAVWSSTSVPAKKKAAK